MVFMGELKNRFCETLYFPENMKKYVSWHGTRQRTDWPVENPHF